jgi:hypothetical protein
VFGLGIVSLLLSLAALGVALFVLRRILRLLRFARPGVDALPSDVLGLRQEVAALRAEVRGSFRHMAVVRYDAFGDMGGQLSWSLALVDDAGDGVVLTSIHGRSDARSYAKSLAGWSCASPLSPEEEQAIDQARPR